MKHTCIVRRGDITLTMDLSFIDNSLKIEDVHIESKGIFNKGNGFPSGDTFREPFRV